jgi:hypothetical protein
MTDDLFATGTAEIVALEPAWLRVRCPFCKNEHAHRRNSRGSRSCLAGCSTRRTPRLYSIPFEAALEGHK